MPAERFKLVSDADGLVLGIMIVRPKRNPTAIVQFSHGMTERKERYLPFMEYLSALGYLCIINDHRGHGESVRSLEDLGYFYENGADFLVQDLHQITEFIRAQYPALPLYLFGHSMGSLAVRTYLKQYDADIDGLIVCGCPSPNDAAVVGRKILDVEIRRRGDHYRSERINSVFLNTFNRRFAPTTSQSAWMCSDEAVIREFDADPLCGFVFTLNGYASLIDLMNRTYDPQGWTLANKELPIWFISGSEDPCMVSREKLLEAVNLLQRVGYENVTFRIYEGMRHEVINEIGKEAVYQDIAKKLSLWTACREGN